MVNSKTIYIPATVPQDYATLVTALLGVHWWFFPLLQTLVVELPASAKLSTGWEGMDSVSVAGNGIFVSTSYAPT
jgi:hypothetical protein